MKPVLQSVQSKNRGANTVKWILCAALFVATGCVVSEGLVNTESMATPPGTLPTEVLEGTQFLQLSDIETATVLQPRATRCHAETGGAELSLDVSPSGGGAWRVRRGYLEPDFDEQSKYYTVHLSGDGLASTNGDIRILATQDGLLVLELVSDNSFIPPEFWIYYSCNGF